MTDIVTSIDQVRSAVAAARARGLAIACVPTMGALHEGHATLIRRARERCGFAVVTIFVNPSQFGPNEDYLKYPRTLEADRNVCEKAGATLIFAPGVEEMYPTQLLTIVDVALLSNHLCGPSRPGHFRGVATVVLKLLNIVQPDVAVFGAKDGQQLRIIRRMVLDLNLAVEIVGVPTVRETDGLAMSTRNRYLTPHERAEAPKIYAALRGLQDRVAAGERDVAILRTWLEAELATISGAKVEYASIVDDETLQPLSRLDCPALAAVAVRLGATRLIDNVTLP